MILASQDWRYQKVNLYLALFTVSILACGVGDLWLSLVIFGFLWLYRQVRPHSIQLLDVIVFSLGAGYFSVAAFVMYCLITAGGLFIMSKFKDRELPFLVAWVIGFWAVLTLQLSFGNDFLPSYFINNLNI